MTKIFETAKKTLCRILPFLKRRELITARQPVRYDALPDGFSADEYFLLNPDVKKAGMEAAAHFREHGAKEGRSFRVDLSVRHGLALTAAKNTPALEIGPFCNPMLKGDGIFYFDVLDRDNLIDRANKIGYPIIYAPQIDYVSGVGDLGIVDRTFASVASSHCIEHQPDFIGHLKAVERILNQGGRYFLIIPDKRYCFDALFSESTLADVLAAHLEQRRLHTARSFLDHHFLITHNDPLRHWVEDHKDPDYDVGLISRARSALKDWSSSQGSYFDVHAWRFTPESFRNLIQALRELGLTNLEIETINETPRNTFEFTAVLRNPLSPMSSAKLE